MQRELAGLTREQLAARAGVDVKTIAKAEAGSLEGVMLRDILAMGVALGASMTLAPASKPPVAIVDILREFDRLIESKRARIFYQQRPDQEHASVFWDIVGDPDRNWLYVVASNPSRNFRVAAISDAPGGWSIAGQLFGMDVETHAIAGKLSEKLFHEHKAALLRGGRPSGAHAN